MAAIIMMIMGAAIGGQFGTVGAIVGAYIGLALTTPIKQTSTFSNIDCGTESKSTLGWIPDFPPAASYSPLANYETPTLHQDVINDSSTLFDDPMSSSEPSHINPATGLPMIDDGITGFDVGGNTFGTSSDDFM